MAKYLQTLSDELYTQEISAKQSTVFGQQIACVARYLLAQNLSETNWQNNLIHTIIKHYYGNSDSAKRTTLDAYCAMFVWYCVNEAAKTSNCVHYFPSYAQAKLRADNAPFIATDYTNQAGNALNTKEAAKREGKYVVNSTPSVGSVFYRISDAKLVNGNKASGHMGVVVEVLPDGSFLTIEGNVKRLDGNDGVAAYKYLQSDINLYKMEFIHTENNACNLKEAIAYKGMTCKYEEKVIVGNTESEKKTFVTTSSGSSSSDEGTMKSRTESNTNKSTTGFNFETATSNEITEKKKQCEIVSLKIPPAEAIPSVANLLQPHLAGSIIADAIDVQSGWANIPNAERNGAALGYWTSQKNTGTSTGFGMFITDKGNKVYIVSNLNERGRQFVESKFIAPSANGSYREILKDSCNVIEIGAPDVASTSAFQKNATASMLLESLTNSSKYVITTEDTYKNNNESVLRFHPAVHNFVQNIKKPTRSTLSILSEVNCHKLYMKPLIEYVNSLDKLNKPIVISIVDWGKSVSVPAAYGAITSIIMSAASFVPVVGQYAQYIPQAVNTLDSMFDAVTGKMNKNSIAQVMQNINSLVSLAEVMAPETVKRAKGSVQNYIDTAKSSVNTWLQDATKSYTIGNALGITSQDVDKIIDRYRNFQTGFIDIAKNAKDSLGLDTINKNVTNFKNMVLQNAIARQIYNGDIERVIGGAAIAKSAVLQDLFIQNQNTGIITLFPDMKSLSSIITGQVFAAQELTDKQGIEGHFGLVKAAFGYDVNPNSFKKWTLQSLVEQAKATAGDFLMPFFDEEANICYKFEVEKEVTGKRIIYCPPGWEWDPTLRKCKSNSVGWTGEVEKKNTTGSQGQQSGGSSLVTSQNSDQVYCKTGQKYENGKCVDIPTTPTQTIVKLPECIILENGKYFYVPTKSKVTQASSLTVSTTPTLNVVNPSNIDLSKLNLPNINPIDAVLSKSTNPSLTVANPIVSLPSGLKLADVRYEAYKSVEGDRWFAKIDGVTKEIIDCIPQEPKAETPKEVDCPQGFRKIGNDCMPIEKINLTTNPIVPTVPSTPSIPTNPIVPTVPSTPTNPIVPTVPSTPNIPTNPIVPTVPSTPTNPIVPTIPSTPSIPTNPIVPTTPSTPSIPTNPIVPTVPSTPSIPTNPTVPTTPSTPSQYLPELPKSSLQYTNNPNDCGCEVEKLKMPKMEFETITKKRIFEYPKSDQHCCDGNAYDDCEQC